MESSRGFRGTVWIRSTSGGVTERAVRAERCDEVASALALIVAILLNPEARPQREKRVALQGEPRPQPTPVRSSERGKARALRLSAVGGMHLGIQGGVAPRVVIGPRWFVGLARRTDDLLTVASSIRVSAYTGRSATARGPIARTSAAFELDSLRADGCAFRLASGGFSIEPCLLFELGRLDATGVAHGRSQAKERSWTAAGALLRGEWTAWKRLVAGVDLGGVVPLRSTRYAFAGDQTFYETPWLGFTGAIGFGMRFP